MCFLRGGSSILSLNFWNSQFAEKRKTHSFSNQQIGLDISCETVQAVKCIYEHQPETSQTKSNLQGILDILGLSIVRTQNQNFSELLYLCKQYIQMLSMVAESSSYITLCILHFQACQLLCHIFLRKSELNIFAKLCSVSYIAILLRSLHKLGKCSRQIRYFRKEWTENWIEFG